MLNLNKIELKAFSDIKFMIAKDLLTTDLEHLLEKQTFLYPDCKDYKC